jgi:hypothetical protein
MQDGKKPGHTLARPLRYHLSPLGKLRPTRILSAACEGEGNRQGIRGQPDRYWEEESIALLGIPLRDWEGEQGRLGTKALQSDFERINSPVLPSETEVKASSATRLSTYLCGLAIVDGRHRTQEGIDKRFH